MATTVSPSRTVTVPVGTGVAATPDTLSVKVLGWSDTGASGPTMFTRLAVPTTVAHSSRPRARSSAVKNTRLPTTVRFCGSELALPGRMSPIRPVLLGCPPLRHSSRPRRASEAAYTSVLPASTGAPGLVPPWLGCQALKNSRLLTTVNARGADPAAPGAMSRTRRVPPAVPSLRQSSRPTPALCAVKYSVSPSAVSWRGSLALAPGRMSATSAVAAPGRRCRRCRGQPTCRERGCRRQPNATPIRMSPPRRRQRHVSDHRPP